MPNRMRMNIATRRRNAPAPPTVPPMDYEYARRPGDTVCPACLAALRKCRSCETEDAETAAVERAAIAIHGPNDGHDEWYWERADPGVKQHYRRKARAALLRAKTEDATSRKDAP